MSIGRCTFGEGLGRLQDIWGGDGPGPSYRAQSRDRYCPSLNPLWRDGGASRAHKKSPPAPPDGSGVFTLAASFHSGESGLEHQAGRLSAPEPEGLDQSSVHPALRERVATQWPGWEFRFVSLAALDAARSGHNQVWIRFRERLPDLPLVHACALMYASDMTLISSTLKVNGHQPAKHGMQLASLDHAAWFNRPFRADEWLLFDQQADAGSEGRGLAWARWTAPSAAASGAIAAGHAAQVAERTDAMAKFSFG